MNLEIPNSLNTPVNKVVLNYLKPLSCHGDNIRPLIEILENYPEVQSFCPNGAEYKYVFYYVNRVIFAFGAGMRNISIKVPEEQQDYAKSTGAVQIRDAGKDWYEWDFQSEYIPEFIEFAHQDAIELN